jgi:1-acyl-sn-glycerol-3-phosphate acyltransferase
MFDFFLKWISKIIIFLLGYEINENIYNIINKNKGYVCICPHTSKFEGFILILINLILQDKKILFAIKSSLYDNYLLQPILKKVGAIRIPTKEEKKDKSTISTICEILNKDEYKNNIFGISPEGTLKPNEWKTGFFYIAKNTNRPIIIGGIDYYNHIIRFCEDTEMIIKDECKYEDIKYKIQEKFSNCKIYPLYHEMSYPNVKINSEFYTTMIDYIKVSNIFAYVISLYYAYNSPIIIYKYICSFIFLTSHLYHCNNEENYLYRIIDIYSTRFLIVYMCYNHFIKIINNFYCLFLLGIVYFIYSYPIKRHKCNFRKKDYIIFHSIFHVFLSFTFGYMINL